jgi:hypothetical protein
MPARRFPPPWSVEELNDACFIVKDSAGQKLAYVYFEDEPGRRSVANVARAEQISPFARMICWSTIAMGNFVPTESRN